MHVVPSLQGTFTCLMYNTYREGSLWFSLPGDTDTVGTLEVPRVGGSTVEEFPD